MPDRPTTPTLQREIGFRDLVLFYVVSGLSIRWIATAAATGPGAIVIWLLALCCFFVPLAASVLELSSRYPQEGGIYVWTRHAFGDFTGFMTGWMYWSSNLAYFPGILYFAARMALYIGPRHWQQMDGSRTYFMAFSIVALALLTLLNVVGLGIGKWVNNIGAFGMWLPVMALMGMAAISWVRFGAATHFTLASMVPSTSWKDLIFLSTIFFAFSGCEAGSFMGSEIRDPRKTIPPALLLAGVLIALGYIGGTVAMLIALPSNKIGGLGGFMEAIVHMADRIGWHGAVPLTALLVTVSSVGAAGAYLSATARLPFVAGIDNYLPAIFGRVHPRWHTPYVALITYGLAGALFAFLGQAGTTVRGAYEVLVSMSIITYFLPYILLFAALVRLQSRPVGVNVVRVPGGRYVATALACLGLISTFLTIVLSLVPAADEPNKILAVAKIAGLTLLLIGAGIAVYFARRGKPDSKVKLKPLFVSTASEDGATQDALLTRHAGHGDDAI